jgi:non-specific serine/threonine protein kinase
VDLAPLADGALVPQSVAAALGVREVPGASVTEALVGSLKGRQLLLLLDNCEHLVEACARLVETLLQVCPRLRVLATSREALGIGGENPYVVPSLSLPDERALATLEGLTQYEAIRLFIERAATVRPAFRVTVESARAVAGICRQLDGMPLAIELAAARVKALSVEQLNERLDDKFRLLTGGSRTALPRHQTLQALIDWSYDLLSPSERTLLRRLSVFAGGWTLEAAERVTCDEVGGRCVGGLPTEGGSRVEEWEVLDLLTSLVEKSMVQYAEPGRHPERRCVQGRYRFLETVRHYGRNRLCEAGEAEAVRGRHRDWCLAYAERAQLKIHGLDQREWLDRLEAEHDNMRAALAWSGAHGQGEVGLRLGAALWPLWWERGYWTEGRKHLAGLLALPETAAPTAARAKALDGAGQLASYQGDNGAGRALYEERLAICRELGDKSGTAWSLWELGWVVRAQGEHGAARSLFEESLAISREVGEKRGVARSLEELGRLAYDQGDYGAAQALLEESLTIFRERGDKPDTVRLLAFLAVMAQAQGDDAKARALCEEALPLARAVEDKVQLMHMLGGIGHAARQQGDYGRARVLYQESLALRQEGRNTHAIAQSLEDFAGLAGRQQQWERAARLLGAAEAVCADLGTALPVAMAAEYWRTVRGARSALGEEAFAAAWAAGRALSLEDAIQFALEDTPSSGEGE